MALIEQKNNTGFHSVIYKGVHPTTGREYLTKHYGPKAEGFTRDDARTIAQSMKRFESIAKEIGVPMATSYGHYLIDNGHPEKVNLVEVVPTAGTDLRALFSDPTVSDSDVLSMIHSYLSIFQTVWRNGFPISLDPPPANFCINTDGKISYVDTMPPRQKLPDGTYITDWPELQPGPDADFVWERYFTKRQAQVIYPQVLRAIGNRPIHHDRIKDAIGEYLGDTAFNAINMPITYQLNLLCQPQPTDVDKLRIVAAQQYQYGHLGADDLKTVYGLCHIHNGGILPHQDDIHKASYLLLRNTITNNHFAFG